ncbi:MAG: DUF1553 domain-containing protein [Planctomycetota bacterium]|nr:MAG: DUF1553 domain-containing protein [Planctomycetota bacterium]
MFSALCLILCSLTSQQGDVVYPIPDSISLTAPGSYATLIVESKNKNGLITDLTDEVSARIENSEIAMIFQGRVYGKKAGNTRLLVDVQGKQLVVPVSYKPSQLEISPTFNHDLEPILARHQCNSSGCHGKAEGQNGFKLSVFGSDPDFDFGSIFLESRGRRVMTESPANSLFVRKMSGMISHGGGARIPDNNPDYQTVINWIKGGAPKTNDAIPDVVGIEVQPPFRIIKGGSKQRLTVFATLKDGSRKEVTAHARFFSNHEALASVDIHGTVSTNEIPGEAVILVTYRNKTSVFRAILPAVHQYTAGKKYSDENWIDQLIQTKLDTLRIPASPLSKDEEFVRRVFLDISGSLPNSSELKAFLANKSADKRSKLVEDLLNRPTYSDYSALVWSDLLRVDRQALGTKQAYAYYRWLKTSFSENKPLDKLAFELLSAQGYLDEHPEGSFYKVVKSPGELSSSFAQIFLGVRIACAECHHHPFDKWTQADYLGMQSFFTGVRSKNAGKREILVGDNTSPGGNARYKDKVFAHALGQPLPEVQPKGDARQLFAQWVISPENQWFARNAANRIWAHLFGHGLVEPIDDFRDTNPASHPELLVKLANHLIQNKYDVKSLIKLITASETYQRSSAPVVGNESDEWNYSRFLLKSMPAEVLFDAISQTTGVSGNFEGYPIGTRAIQLWDSRYQDYFLKVHGRPLRVSSCSCERQKEPGIAQVLHELNSPELHRKLNHEQGKIAKLVAANSSQKEIVEELFLSYFSRFPSKDELELANEVLAKAKDATSKREALEDLAWGMMNSLEFLFNH